MAQKLIPQEHKPVQAVLRVLLEAEADLARRADTQSLPPAEWKKLREINRDLREEMVAEIESALGADWVELSSSLTGFPEMADGLNQILSSEKRAQLREIDKQFRRELDELQEKQMIWGLEPEEVATLRNLERQKRAALAAVLSPQELEEYLYRNSPAADYVRRNLPEAKSESEYRTMVKLALDMEMSPTLDSPRQNYGMDSDSDEAKLESKQRREDYAQRLKDLLGQDRIAEQQAGEKVRADAETKAREEQDKQRMQQELTTMAAEVGVNEESANRFAERLLASMPVLKKKFDEMEKGLSGTPEEKAAQMQAAVKAELHGMAVEIMGDKGPAVVERMLQGKR